MLNYFINQHVADGYEFILPPHLLEYECGLVAGQFPKFSEEVFSVETREGERPRFLVPTAETALVNLHRDEVLDAADLPLRYVAYTPCYRREAGSYRTLDRGTLRGHQFNKVELFQYVAPGDSEQALEQLLGQAEKIVRSLGLHYRISKLAAGDASAHAAKTFDIEVYLPSTGTYEEVSSASNVRDYQARRGNIRVRLGTDQGRQTVIAHTLNASGLATSRLLPALIETHQQKDGSIDVPEPLRPLLGLDRIG